MVPSCGIHHSLPCAWARLDAAPLQGQFQHCPVPRGWPRPAATQATIPIPEPADSLESLVRTDTPPISSDKAPKTHAAAKTSQVSSADEDGWEPKKKGRSGILAGLRDSLLPSNVPAPDPEVVAVSDSHRSASDNWNVHGLSVPRTEAQIQNHLLCRRMKKAAEVNIVASLRGIDVQPATDYPQSIPNSSPIPWPDRRRTHVPRGCTSRHVPKFEGVLRPPNPQQAESLSGSIP